MISRVLLTITRRLGARGLIVVLLAPLLAGAVTLLILPLLLRPSVQASAKVGIQPVIGTYASFEVTTYVADFLNALAGPAAAAQAAGASGMNMADAAAALTATNEGGYAGAVVTYTAPTADLATQGLRAAARTALVQIVQYDVARARIEFESAKASIAALMQAFDGSTFVVGTGRLNAEDRAAARQQALQTASERVESTQADLLAAQGSLRAVETVLQSATVTTQQVSTRPDEIRALVTTQLTAFVLALALVTLLRRRSARQAAVPATAAT